MSFLDYERVVNLGLSLLALILILGRSKEAVTGFGPKRLARYTAYTGLIFLMFEGNLESILQSSPTGIKTVLATFVLVYVIYSEWPERAKPKRKPNDSASTTSPPD